MRVGKSPLAIRLAAKNCISCLCIVPKPLLEQWREYIKLWDDKGIMWEVIGKEQFRINYKDIQSYDGLIIDEVHRQGGNYKSKFFKAVMAYKKRYAVNKLWILSGTPFSNNSFSVYSLALLLGRQLNWWDWRNRYFNMIRMGVRLIPIQKTGIEKEMAQWIKSLGYVLKLSDVGEVPDDEYINEYFDLNGLQKDLIKNSFDPLPVVRFTRYHQIESGCLKSDGYAAPVIVQCQKTDRILELAEENDKLAIVCRYNLQIENYKQTLEENGYRVLVINGATKDRNEVIKQIDLLGKCIVLIQSQCSDGYSLKSIGVMVFASMSFSFVDYKQMTYRVKDMDKKTGNTYIHLLTRDKGSVDQGVFDSVKKKEDFNIEIFKK
jgi:superfamily II DNA or RNA helicase